MSDPTLSREWERWQALWRRAGNAGAVAHTGSRMRPSSSIAWVSGLTRSLGRSRSCPASALTPASAAKLEKSSFTRD